MVTEKFPQVKIKVYTVQNRFFGETVTVSGLVTGGDLIAQLEPYKAELGEKLYIPKNMLKADEDIFLDNITLSKVSEKLGVPVIPASDEGYDLIEDILG